MKEKKKNKTALARSYSQGFTDGRKQGHSEGYELGIVKGYELALSDVMDYVLGKMEDKTQWMRM